VGKYSQDPISKITRVKWTGGVAQVIEHLLCKCKVLRSNSSPFKKKDRKKEREREKGRKKRKEGRKEEREGKEGGKKGGRKERKKGSKERGKSNVDGLNLVMHACKYHNATPLYN
jgi:hypothetical protein